MFEVPRRSSSPCDKLVHCGALSSVLLCWMLGFAIPLASAQEEGGEIDPSFLERGEDDADEAEGEESEAEVDEAGADEPMPDAGDSDSVGAGDEADLGRFQMARDHRPGFATYRLPESQIWSPLTWAGGQLFAQVEIDVGYATYRYPEYLDRPEETLHDMRGRFVLGPLFHYDLSEGLYLSVLGQVVAWVREQEQQYQINVDDLYVQIGSGTKWDFQIGRFMTWRVYHRGLGFDIFTLEDQGTSKSYPISNGDFAVHTYEVDYIFLRNSPYVGGEVAGRAAFHYYPVDILGFELAAAYGLAGSRSLNTLGARLAADLQWEFLRLSAGAEYRRQRQTGPPHAVQNAGTPQEVTVECALCGGSNNYGFGGSAMLTFSPVRVGGGIARGIDEGYANTADENGAAGANAGASGHRMSTGGFGELDVGSLLFQRSFIIGAGYQRTELVYDNNNQEYHYQSAVYAAYPLAVNDAMIKLVLSQAKADLFNPSSPGGTDYIDFHPSSTTARVRFSTNF